MTVAVVGVFDGVHAGHRALVAAAREVASADDIVAVSFDPHPVAVLRPDEFQGLITLPPRRAQLLRECGVDRVDYISFDHALTQLSPDEFVAEILIERIGASDVVVGNNFRFGHRAAGDVHTLEVLAHKYGFTAHVLPLSGDAATYSSTRIRNAILSGAVREAGQVLGRPFELSGVVGHGDKRGRRIGYPTANIIVDQPLIVPADGVYSAMVDHRGDRYPAAVSIGTNPTFEGVVGRRVEAYVLDRDDLDLYDEQLTLEFVDFIRPMVAFDGLPALLEAMALDVAIAREQLSDLG